MKLWQSAIAGLAIAVVLLMAERTTAADAKGQFAVKGIGRASCEDFLAVKKAGTPEYRQFGGWIGGYITGLNQSSQNTFDLVMFENIDTLSLYVEGYCRSNPNDRFIGAVRRIVTDLEPTRILQFGDLVKFGNDPTIELHRQVVDAMVRRLRDLGNFGSDQKVGDPSRIMAALRRYQHTVGLEETGLPDQRTLVKLLRENKVAP